MPPCMRKLLETRLEMRDGGTWLVGRCPECWELVAKRTPIFGTIRCQNGHTLRAAEMRSEGAHHYEGPGR